MSQMTPLRMRECGANPSAAAGGRGGGGRPEAEAEAAPRASLAKEREVDGVPFPLGPKSERMLLIARLVTSLSITGDGSRWPASVLVALAARGGSRARDRLF